MNDINYKSPLLALDEAWNELSQSEKALCISYKRLLLNNLKASSKMIEEISLIYAKYPDFHIGCIPNSFLSQEKSA